MIKLFGAFPSWKKKICFTTVTAIKNNEIIDLRVGELPDHSISHENASILDALADQRAFPKALAFNLAGTKLGLTWYEVADESTFAPGEKSYGTIYFDAPSRELSE